MDKMRNNFQQIVECCNSDNRHITVSSKKRRKAINYIDQRLKKLEQFIITIDQFKTTIDCNIEFRRKIDHLINEIKFDLNEGLFYNGNL